MENNLFVPKLGLRLGRTYQNPCAFFMIIIGGQVKYSWSMFATLLNIYNISIINNWPSVRRLLLYLIRWPNEFGDRFLSFKIFALTPLSNVNINFHFMNEIHSKWIASQYHWKQKCQCIICIIFDGWIQQCISN